MLPPIGAPPRIKPPQLSEYLYEQIPLARAMAVTVLAIEADAVTLEAPLAPNINHRRTVFGGSASALALLAGWSLLHVRLHSESIASRLVIQRNTMEYLHPIEGPFTARATLEHPERWKSFITMLMRRGKGRVGVGATLAHGRQLAGRFMGEFVALAGGAAETL
ncbi:MAG: YiiD C-terminal domain-containing protein [Gammaproteobacteria bacterium]|nr:YiiD C-terminal domain-containing protein [Gammaproteobacteria bacterium]MBV8306032.1 YiiD C-terminal domain-containing protein [Gammaproteobacteria bacterium]